MDHNKINNLLSDTLHLHKTGVISIIGAGGKTSLMFQLARELSKLKNRVLTTTTTKIFMPKPLQSPDTIIENSVDKLIQRAKINLKNFSHFSAGKKYDPVSKKLIGFSTHTINQLWKTCLFDWIIVEADGAKQRSHKASGSHEPVIPKDTTHLILVTGLDAVGKTLDDHSVHRPEIFSNNTGTGMGDVIDEQSIAASIDFEIKKAESLCCPAFNFILLNKADTLHRTASGKKIAKLLKKNKIIEKIIVTSLKDGLSIKHIV
ncbi:MAG: putative selenium-dependent hydroxylase accessory protein YqeC [Desulfobacula sp.]|nr:putative selenium-dependent hydroxylase accessory protein YqeC [Desulfobacula sp.]